MTQRFNLTEVLLAYRANRKDSQSDADRIFKIVYDELHHLASSLMQKERFNHTLQPTALVSEAYCRLVDHTRVDWQNRAHFFGAAARAMRQILVDHARRRAADKRGGGWRQITLDEGVDYGSSSNIEIRYNHEGR